MNVRKPCYNRVSNNNQNQVTLSSQAVPLPYGGKGCGKVGGNIQVQKGLYVYWEREKKKTWEAGPGDTLPAGKGG